MKAVFPLFILFYNPYKLHGQAAEKLNSAAHHITARVFTKVSKYYDYYTQLYQWLLTVTAYVNHTHHQTELQQPS